MSIVVEKVSKIYGQQRALNDVSFEIQRGEIVGFLGPNGAGKSTMMKIITCYIPPSSGKVKVCGHDVMEQSIEAKRCIGYLPEHNPLYTDMYVREAHKKIETLSKGYRQRVGLAQALIHDPQVLVLDEPTSGLDPNQLAEIRNLIVSVGKTKTVMLSTHIMQEVEAMCDRAFIIDRGNIVADSLSMSDIGKRGKSLEEIFREVTKS